MSNLVSVLILNWNRKHETSLCIESILQQSYKNIQIVVIDNYSTDGSQLFLKNKYSDNVKFIELDHNYGCPGGRNLGLKYCDGDYIFFCDNDGLLHNKAIENSLNLILHSDNIAIVSGVINNYKSIIEIDLNKLLTDNNVTEVFNFLGGVCMLNVNAINNKSIYPDCYIYGGEEEYFSYRLLDRGFKLVKSNNVILFHKKSLLARNTNLEYFNLWFNRFLNAYQLFPIEYFIFYTFYFYIFYTIKALKLNHFYEYYKANILMYKKIKFLKRLPVKRTTFYKIIYLTKFNTLFNK
jgi:glycosyltransferase involved in cell wall biosynthesis